MINKLISIFFSVVFIFLITAPTVLTFIDENADIALFFEYPEEEEMGKETNKKIEVFLSDIPDINPGHQISKESAVMCYVIKSYNTPDLNLILPPPEVVS